jgi:hypothetical protein
MNRGLSSARLLNQLLDAGQGELVGDVNADPTVMRDLLVELFALTAHGVSAEIRRERAELSVIDGCRYRAIVILNDSRRVRFRT